MSLFKFLAVILATCGSNCGLPTKPLHYAESLKEFKVTEKIFTDVILSMAEGIPHLGDYRRHYSEITHSIYHIATVLAHNCNQIDTKDLYDRLVEEAVAEVIGNPREVVETTQQFLDDFNSKTTAIQNLINISCAADINERDCDEVIQNFILDDPEKYATEANIILIAGESAKAFNSNSDKFNYISKELEAHKFVSKQSAELKNVVDALTKLLYVMDPTNPPC
ncbi:unnamed protein product [Arctia plantaginis]|uniref:Uncharacterized protein n=1 Tax=Arctia plantaginis TaxID=874455 RepID=A0A8S1BL41_ARCPL|nr:unnamed protein product [Arctia plantaginis]